MPELKSQGTEIFCISAGSPQALREIGKIVAFGGLGGSAGEINITHLQSARKEFLRGLQDGGTVNLDINLDTADTGQDELWLINTAAKAVRWCIALSDNTTQPTLTGNTITPPTQRTSFTFDAYIQQITVNGQADDAIRMSVALRVTGDIVYTQKP